MDGAQDRGASASEKSRVDGITGGAPVQFEQTDDGELLISSVADVLVFSAPIAALPAVLSESERSVASLLIAGRSNAEIAEARATSSKTVANQLYAMYRKLGVRTRDELVAALVEPLGVPLNADDPRRS